MVCKPFVYFCAPDLQGNVKDMEDFVGFFGKLRSIADPQCPIASAFFIDRQVRENVQRCFSQFVLRCF